jgi:hypothetical protein
MKSLMSLWSQVAEESATYCRTSATSDINTVKRRFEDEGLSFLTITLPDLGKSFEKWLDEGRVGINSSFRRERRGRLPRFLGGFFSRVFDPNSGALVDDPDIEAILAIRQLTLMFGKLEYPCTDARIASAMTAFVDCEKEVRKSDSEISEEDFRDFERMSALLFQSAFTRIDREIYYDRVIPKHGPGSVADRLTSNGKYRLRTWTDRLDSVFPATKYLIPNIHFRDELDQVNFLEPGSEMPVRVIAVPKTLKTPRIIAVEPACMQYMQQGILRLIREAFERDELLDKVIGFDDQTPNQVLACQGSLNGETATLDLSEASDRVSNELVRRMTSRWPWFSRALDATRSRRADVEGHGIIPLAKYASMGSATCFPVEAMVFTTLIFLGIERSLNVTLTRKDLKSLSGVVRVFGDDLIVPVDHVHMVVNTLEAFGSRVGAAKSFWTGRFRESCGKEYFNGNDISIVRCRQALPSTSTDADGVISTVALRNLFYEHGYWRTARWLDKKLLKVLKHFPIVSPASPVLGRVSFLGYETQRMHPRLHSPLVRGYVQQSKAPSDKLGDTGALLKCLLKLESENPKGVVESYLNLDTCSRSSTGSYRALPIGLPPGGQDEKHLERSGRPQRVGIKSGWWSSI